MNELEIIRHQRIDGLSLFVDTLDHRTPHFHPEWELIWVLDQPLTVTCDQRESTLAPGQFVLFEPDNPHEFHKQDKSSTFLCLQISPALLPAGAPLRLDGHFPHDHLPARELQWLKKTMADTALAYFREQDHYALLCLGNSARMLHTLLTHMPCHTMSAEERASANRRNARLKRLIRYVDENYMHKIRLADFARAENCSVGYLSHFIKDAMNQTFQEYVNSVRFGCACKLIAAGELRMLDVCMESGFSDYRYFSKSFKDHYGMTPDEFSRRETGALTRSCAVRRSLHSVERFYTPGESLELLAKLIDL